MVPDRTLPTLPAATIITTRFSDTAFLAIELAEAVLTVLSLEARATVSAAAVVAALLILAIRDARGHAEFFYAFLAEFTWPARAATTIRPAARRGALRRARRTTHPLLAHILRRTHAALGTASIGATLFAGTVGGAAVSGSISARR